MKFYSGFLLQDDERFFKQWLSTSRYCVAGFSYGAILALKEALKTDRRIDKIQLFSPAFFIDRDSSFKEQQIKQYIRNQRAYERAFVSNLFAPYKQRPLILKEDGVFELKELLSYEWSKKDLQKLKDRGVEIEVYLATEDRIINYICAKEHFLPYATVVLLKGANHMLIQDNATR